MRLQRQLEILASLKITVIGLIYLAFLLIIGTIYQAEFGLYAAKAKFFDSYFVVLMGFLVLPATQLVLLCLAINLIASLILKIEFKPMNIGLNLTHISTLLLLISSLVSMHSAIEAELVLHESERTNIAISKNAKPLQLPFAVELNKFTKIDYEGTSVAKSYSSQIYTYHGQQVRKSTISMNKPYRYKDYTLYQNSFKQNIYGDYSTVLAVVKNPARIYPYIFSILASLGLLLHFLIKLGLFIQAKPNTAKRQRHGVIKNNEYDD